MKKIIFLLLMAALVAALIILAAESMIRFSEGLHYKSMLKEVKQSNYQEDKDIGFGYIPGNSFDQDGVNVKINSGGFRDAEHSLQKSKFRILAVGDSFTFGWKTRYEDMFLTRLENLLGEKAEIIKMGISGNGADKDFKVIKYKGIKYHPDLIILNFYIGSDFTDDLSEPPKVINGIQIGALVFDPYENIGGRLYPYAKFRTASFLRWRVLRFAIFMQRTENALDGFFLSAKQAIYDSFLKGRLSRALNTRIENNLNRSRMKFEKTKRALKERNPISKYLRTEITIYHKEYSDYLKKGTKRVLETVKKMNDFSRANNADFLVAILPADIQVDPVLFENIKIVLRLKDSDYDVLKPAKMLVDFCRKNNIQYIDLYPALKQAYNRGVKLYLPDYDRHWTPEAHLIVAQALKDGIMNLNLLKNR